MSLSDHLDDWRTEIKKHLKRTKTILRAIEELIETMDEDELDEIENFIDEADEKIDTNISLLEKIIKL